MSRISVPVGQKLHTNVIVVRLTRAKRKFEIACYPNKVQEWRSGVEKDIDEVLQTDRVFVNVAQGEFAKHSELKLAFGTDNEAEICLEVLKLGEVQISEKERAKQHDECFHEIATIVVEKCVDANTNRALTVAMVERAMKQIQIRVLPNKSAKQQALKVIPELSAKFPIVRAKMLVRVTIAATYVATTKAMLGHLIAQTLNEVPRADESAPYIVVGVIEPARYRDIDALVSGGEKGSLEVLNPRVVTQ